MKWTASTGTVVPDECEARNPFVTRVLPRRRVRRSVWAHCRCLVRKTEAGDPDRTDDLLITKQEVGLIG